MVDFKAYRFVNIEELGELGHIADTGPADIHHKTSSGFIITQGEDHRAIVDFVVTGHNIKYLGGILPNKGTVTHLMVKVGHKNAYEFSNDTYSVAKALDLYLQDNPFKAARSIFSGNDKIVGSSGDDQLAGFNGNDRIWGRGGDDRLKGGNGDDKIWGGVGNDRLKGEDGDDRFYFDTALDADTNVDTILDFTLADDLIVLDISIFTALGAVGALAEAAFVIGAAATDDEHRVVFDDSNGALYYDADGNGAGEQVQFAKVAAGLDLTAGHFLVVA